jgi:hypothetical protein
MMLRETAKWCGYRTHIKTLFIGEFDEKRDELQKIPSKVPSFTKVSPCPTPRTALRRAPQRQQAAIKPKVNQALRASRCCPQGS